MRTASYSSRGRLSRAILALYANQDPRDWTEPDRSVISSVYYSLTYKPNLHHVFPMNFIENHYKDSKLNSNSLMNIVYLTQLTNLKISDKNPLEYLKDYDCKEFEAIFTNHLMPIDILQWSRLDEMPENSLDIFIEKRIDNIIVTLKNKINVEEFEVIDTK